MLQCAKSQFCFVYLTLQKKISLSLCIQNSVFHFVTCCYREGLWTPHPTPMLDDHPLCAVRDCMFNIIAATLHIWRLSPPSPICGHAMPWWKWPTFHTLQLTLKIYYIWYTVHYNQLNIRYVTRWYQECSSKLQWPAISDFLKIDDIYTSEKYGTYTLWIAYPATYSVGTRSSSTRGGRLKARGWLWPPCSAGVKNECSSTSTFPYAFMMCTDTYLLH